MKIFWWMCIISLVHVIKSIKGDGWEDVHMICPQHCVCQYAHRMDLPISRWIHSVETRQRKGHEFVDLHDEPLLNNNNEVIFDDDISPQNNELLKFTMCLLQSNTEPKDLIASLPHDVEALVILSTESRKNMSVLVSDFNQLFDLKTLEIRGSKENKQLTLLFDEPLSSIQHLNIESVQIEAASRLKFRPNLDAIDPSSNFNYIPNCERLEYNISFETPEEMKEKEMEIVPYEIYKLEKLRQRTITFYGWDNLKVLRIKECDMSELYWEMFDGLSSLEHLSLEDNGIKYIPPFSFYGTPNIKSLSLSNNEIFDMNYRCLAGLLELQLLDLSHNNIGKLSEQTFPPFPKLEIVDLSDNPIRNLFPSIFGVMNKTEVLYVGAEDVPLELNAPKPFEDLASLIYLEIPNLHIPKMDESVFSSLQSLEILKIRHGNIPYVEFDSFSKLLKLKEMHMSNCNIQEISMDTFFGAKRLEIVDLSHNSLKTIPSGLFDDQHELKEIYLNDNQLKNLPADIFKLNSLKMIQLLNNPWECTCDMKNWRQGLTNKFRSRKIENKCSQNALKQNKFGCESASIQTYLFDHKQSPKCESPAILKDKSVFYALRRVLQCKSDITQPATTTMKPDKRAKKIEKYNRHMIKKTQVNRNSLRYQLFNRRNYENLKVKDETPNEIL